MSGLASIVSAFIMPSFYHLRLVCTKSADEPLNALHRFGGKKIKTCAFYINFEPSEGVCDGLACDKIYRL